MCSNNSCFFIVDTSYYIDVILGKDKVVSTNQINLGIIKYVYDNYELNNTEYGFNTYSN